MSIINIIDYDDIARARMLQQFKLTEAPNLEKLLQTFVGEIQEIENVLFDLFLDRSVKKATGDQLDTIGAIVGIDREARTNVNYRSAIQTQIQVNNTGGQESSIAAFLVNLVAPVTIDITETFPAGLDIAIDKTGVIANTISLLRKAVAATVSLQFAQVDPGETPFAFSGSIFGNGFGNLVTPTEGGVFAFIITEV